MRATLCFATIPVAFIGMSGAAPPPGRFTLYAYGHNITGLPIFFSNNLAYIGSPNLSSGSFNVTFSIANQGLVASPNITNSPGTLLSTYELYIVNSNNAFQQVGFATSGSSPAEATTRGFGFYGHDVMFFDDSGNALSKFWAVNIQHNQWKMNWNENGTYREGYTPVALRSVPPNIVI
ncbi:hypothetical protein PT974_01661 [Cladobotryum mycophilum]|uniref:Uncharacterized protein n=1 Tax=Cladobotryum mycophilum TaxID=491253 RepID=A0ABR0T4B8_9HYPO